MFPLSAARLSFLKIADYWSRESLASPDELLAELEAAWWQGKITGNSGHTRLQLLRIMYQSRHDLQSVVFVTRNDASPPTATPLPDGGFVVDLTPRISVPAETEDWTESSCNDAFEELARLPSKRHFQRFSYSICFIELTPEEFLEWVTRSGFAAPKFWQRTAETGMTQVGPRGSNTPNDFDSPPERIFSGRGAKRRAIQDAFKALFPNGEIPPGMTSERRNQLIFEWLERDKIRPLPDKRTIERAIRDLTKK